MPKFVIDTDAGTVAVNGSEPQQYDNIEQVCELLEKVAGESESPEQEQVEGGDEGQQAVQPDMSEDEAMQKGFSQARGKAL